MSSVAVCYGRQADQISAWYRIYLQHGIISSKRGRPSIMKKEMVQESSSQCHKQFKGISKPKSEVFIDDIIPDGN